MANHLEQLLDHWFEQRDALEWVLGTVYKTEGSCYRRAGAMTLFNSLGQQFGLLSGGCLEKELRWQAARVMQSHQAVTLCYNDSDDDDLSIQTKTGCGGTVWILLQPVLPDQDYLGLLTLRNLLQQQHIADFWQRIPEQGEIEAKVLRDTKGAALNHGSLRTVDGQPWLVTSINPAIHLLVVGGGEDARPLAALAKNMGWRVTLCDPRPAYARTDHFPRVNTILRGKVGRLSEEAGLKHCAAAVIMTHNLTLDTEAMVALQSLPSLKYVALLGPESRKQKVLNAAGLNESSLVTPIAGPAGLRLGGELPESIALSILAECHAVLHRANARSISDLDRLQEAASCSLNVERE